MKTGMIIALLSLLLLSACGGPSAPQATPTAVSVANPTPTDTLQPPIPTPSPTITPSLPTITPQPPTSTPKPPTSTPLPPSPTAVGWQPLPSQECEALADMLAEQLTASTAITTSAFVVEPNTALLDNTACRITAVATNQILGVADGLELADKVATALAPLGWSQDMNSVSGVAAFSEVVADYYKGEALCKLAIVGRPAEEVKCPEALSPIGCFYELPPAQQLYTIQLTCAQPALAS